MILITDKQLCCGCSACAQRCPKHCIDMREDNEGFVYPHIDTSACIDCGLCEKLCPFINQKEERYPRRVLAVINNDEDARRESSSGGMFTLIAEQIIRDGGIVFGARFDEQWQVVFDYVETLEGLAALRGSKYVQARIYSSYTQCESFLKTGRKVLFTGSPCQIAGLNHYLHRSYENLLTCDFVCHGVPSPKVWRIYLDEVVAAGRKAINDIKFRNKDNGWKRFNFVISCDDDSLSLSSFHGRNHYMRAFLSDLILRPSCYSCKAKQGRSGSDITIADFWGIQYHHPEMDDDKGTSLVFINTPKGYDAIDLSQTKYVVADYDMAVSYNGGLKQSIAMHNKRDYSFKRLDSCGSIIDLIQKCIRPSLRHRMMNKSRYLAKKLLKLFGGGVNIII